MRSKVTGPLVVVLLLCSVAVVGSPLLGTASAGATVVAGPMEDLGGLTTIATGRASDLNESGVIVGESNNRAFRYEPTTGDMIDISPLPASVYSRATGINEAGTIVGITNPFPDTIDFPAGLSAGSFVHDPASGDSTPLALSSASAVNDSGLVSGMQLGTRRAVWHDLATGVTTNIPLPVGSTPVGEGSYQFSSAADINATGVVAGSAYYPLLCVPPSPCLLSNGYRYTTTPPAATSARFSGSIWGEEVMAINDDGDVTSAVITFPPPTFTPQGPFGLVTDQSGLAIDVPTLGGSFTIPHDINDSGVVVGESETDTGHVHAFVFDSNTSQMLDLGTLGGANSKASAINDSGLVVGEAANASGVTRPFRIQTEATTGSVVGRVTNSDGSPASDVWVQLFRPTDVWIGSYGAATGPDGSFSIDGVSPGSYVVYFVPPAASGLPRIWLDGAASRSAATPIVVDAGTQVDATQQLEGAATISGNVVWTGAIGVPELPLPGVRVQAYRPADGWVGSIVTTTGNDGTYTLAGLTPGDYQVYFTPPPQISGVREWFDNAPTRSLATTVHVTAGGALTGVDAWIA